MTHSLKSVLISLSFTAGIFLLTSFLISQVTYAQGPVSVTFDQPTYTVNENVPGQTLNISIRATGIISSDVEVKYSAFITSPRTTAQEGVDYILASGILTFSIEGAQEQTIALTILDDDIPESTETLELDLVATLATDDSTTAVDSTIVTIIDDCDIVNGSFETAQNLLIPSIGDDRLGGCLADSQYFVFSGKAGRTYEIATEIIGNSIDTNLFVFDNDDRLNPVANNDDETVTTNASKVTFTATTDKNYFVRVDNELKDITNYVDTYKLSIQFLDPLVNATDTPVPVAPEATPTRIPPDAYEDNHSFDVASVIAPETVYDLNFVPVAGSGPDNDFFRMWVKEGWSYSCETIGLSPYNDTNMIIYDQNRNGLAGNDDKADGDLGSKVEYTASYTGWLYVLIGPNVEVNYNVSGEYAYQLECISFFGAPTATPRPFVPASNSAPPPTATPTLPTQIETTPQVVTPQAAGTITGIDNPDLQITIQPLASDAPQEITLTTEDFSVNVTIEVVATAEDGTETSTLQGVSNIPVALYDQSGQLLAFGYTNLQGGLLVKLNSDTSEISVVIPYFGIREQVQFSQTRALNIQLPPVELASEPTS